MKVTGFDVDGISVMAHCFERDGKWRARVVAKGSSFYLNDVEFGLDAESSDEIYAKARTAIQELDPVISRFNSEVRMYRKALEAFSKSLEDEHNEG